MIRIELPEGDLMRQGVPKANGVALGFAQHNVGKQHVCIDLRPPEIQHIAQQLAGSVDIVVEN